MVLLIDNYDSFTYNIVHMVEAMGYDVDVFRNDYPVEQIDLSKYTSVILSPGPSTPENSGITLDILKIIGRTPVLGICLGMQAIVHVSGGKVIKAPCAVHGKQDIISHTGDGIFRGIPQRFKAVRYHSLCAEKETLPYGLEVEAYSSDGVIQAVRHVERNIYGLQFHPESFMTEYGEKLMNNFLSIVEIV